MNRPLASVSVLAAALVAIGCGERVAGPPSGPQFHTILNTGSGCDFQHISQLANSYFSSPTQQTVKTLVDSMTAGGSYSAIAKDVGFSIMAQMETVVNNGTAGDPSVGSNLVNHLILCMYNPATADSLSYPASFPDTFNVALTPSSTGAFGQRSTGSVPVYSRPFTAPFTAIAPATDSTWAGVLGPNNNPARVVFYGRPATGTGATDTTYDWRTIPHNATFSPNIIVAICYDADLHPTTMLNEQNVAILSFVDVGTNILQLGSCSTQTALLDATGPFQLARRLVRFGTGLLTPSPLRAAALSPGGLGGTSSKCCSKVGPEQVTNVKVEFFDQPRDAIVNKTIPPPVTVKVYSADDGTPVAGVQVTLDLVNNNGNKVVPLGNVETTQIVDRNGTKVALAIFSHMSTNKPGGYAAEILPYPATAVVGRPSVSTTIVTPVSKKFNVKSK